MSMEASGHTRELKTSDEIASAPKKRLYKRKILHVNIPNTDNPVSDSTSALSGSDSCSEKKDSNLYIVNSDKDTLSLSESSSLPPIDADAHRVNTLKNVITRAAPDIDLSTITAVQDLRDIRKDLEKRGILSTKTTRKTRKSKRPKTSNKKPEEFSSAYETVPITQETNTPELYSTPQNTPELEGMEPQLQDSTALPKNPNMRDQTAMLSEQRQKLEQQQTDEHLYQQAVEGRIRLVNNVLYFGNIPMPLDELQPDHPDKYPTRSDDQMDITPSSQKFSSPKKVTKLSSILKKYNRDTNPTTTSNKYARLPLPEDPPQPSTSAKITPTQQEIRSKTKTTTNKKPPIPVKKANCPPIVLSGSIENHKHFTEILDKHIKKGYYIKYAARTTLLYVKDDKEYQEYKSNLITNQEEFFTYSSKTNKTHAFVLKGLRGPLNMEEIRTELEEEHDINVKNLFKMKTQGAPMYLVITDDSITLKHLQTNVKFIMHTKITWERRLNQRPITQCRRCQSWGHATSNCFRAPTCVICAGSHWTRDCNKPTDDPVKCANCKGPHTASNIECPIYIKKLNQINALTPANNPSEAVPQYIDAPLPKVNPWTKNQVPGAQEAATSTATHLAPPTNTETHLQRSGPPQPSQRNQSPPTNMPHGVTSDLSELMRASSRLNSLIDLKQAIKAINHLSTLLEQTEDPMETINILMAFSTEVLPSYHIVHSRS